MTISAGTRREETGSLRDLYTFDRAEWRIIGVILAIALLARISCFQLGYSIDDYLYLIFNPTPLAALKGTLPQGRWGAGAVNFLLCQLGIGTTRAYAVSTVLLQCALVWLGVVVARIWRVSEHRWLTACIAGMIALHPYQSEVFSFRGGVTLYLAAGLVVTTSAIYASTSYRRSLPALVVFALALSLYQVTLNYMAMLMLSTVAVALARHRSLGPVKWPDIVADTHLGPRALTLGGGTALYLSIDKLIRSIYGVEMVSRGSLIGVSEIPARIRVVAGTLITVLFRSEPVFPAGGKLLLFGLLVVAVLSLFRKPPLGFAKLAAALAILAACQVWILGVVMASPVYWMVPRVMAHAGIFWGAVCAMAYVGSARRMRRAVLIAASVLLFTFVELNSAVFADQLRVNIRDRELAVRILARLEAQPGFAGMKELAIFGRRFGFPSEIGTVQGDLNVSAFGAEWAKLSTIDEVSGYRFTSPSSPAVLKDAADKCRSAAKWPAPESVFLLGNMGVVCLDANE